MKEYCPYCNEFMEISKNSPECTHLSKDPENEWCCPNCDVHFDLDLNEVPTDIGIARPNPTPPPSQNPSQDSNTESSTKPTKPKIDSIYAPPPSKILPSQKVLKAIESLQGYLKQAI